MASADISVSSHPEKDQVKLGEQFDLTLEVLHDDGYTVAPPSVGETLGDFHVVKSSKQEDMTQDGRHRIVHHYTLAGFKLDRATISSIEVGYRGPGGKPGLLTTDPQGITMISTVPEAETQVEDIRNMAVIEPRMALWFKVFLALVAAAAVGLVLWFVLRRRRQAAEDKPKEKPLPPSVVALAKLKQLVESDLLFEGKHKEFYFRLSEILREFMTGRLGVAAVDMTTTEIEYAIRDNPISSEFCTTLLEILRFSDMVKFAKLIPTDEENERMVERTRHAIDLGQEPLFDDISPEAERAVEARRNTQKGAGVAD